MPRPHRLTALALAAAAALPVAGCADDAPPTRVRDGRATVTLDDFSITPQRLRAKPGRLEIRERPDRDTIVHAFPLSRLHVTGRLSEACCDLLLL